MLRKTRREKKERGQYECRHALLLDGQGTRHGVEKVEGNALRVGGWEKDALRDAMNVLV